MFSLKFALYIHFLKDKYKIMHINSHYVTLLHVSKIYTEYKSKILFLEKKKYIYIYRSQSCKNIKKNMGQVQGSYSIFI